MGNNNDFESKHPRSADGKFTEKYRAESGLELSVDQPFTPPDTPEDCERGQIFVGEVKYHDPNSPIGDMTDYEAPDSSEISYGDWWLVEKIKYDSGGSGLTYRTQDGYVQESYGEEGNLENQEFLDENFEPAPIEEEWGRKTWWENGKLASRRRDAIPEVDVDPEYLKEYIEDRCGKMTVAEYFDHQGQKTGQRYYTASDGELFEAREKCSPDRQTRSKISYSFDGVECAPENESCNYQVLNGFLQAAHYKVKRGGESVYHRTDGPAIFRRAPADGRRERYFLEGKEYTKAEWEKKVGR